MPAETNLSEADLKKMEKQHAADKKAVEEEAAKHAEPKPCELCKEKEELIEVLRAAQMESSFAQTIEPAIPENLSVDRSSVVRISKPVEPEKVEVSRGSVVVLTKADQPASKPVSQPTVTSQGSIGEPDQSSKISELEAEIRRLGKLLADQPAEEKPTQPLSASPASEQIVTSVRAKVESSDDESDQDEDIDLERDERGDFIVFKRTEDGEDDEELSEKFMALRSTKQI